MTRKSKQDWLEQGLNKLAEQGLSGLTIEAMAASLELTKGSFYHHFRNIEDFEAQLLDHWTNQYLSTSGELPTDPHQSLALLDTIMQETFSPITAPEVAIRMWAAQDTRACSCVEKVDAHRRNIVLEIFRGLVEDEQTAGLMADLLFTMTIGSMTVLPRIPPDRVLALYKEFKRIYRL